jgi:SNF2 family DNA or RNA helicase
MRTYGDIHLLLGGQMWEISNLEPHVAIRLKQLFPRVPKESAGPFRLRHDQITDADLEWFLRRYPLRISKKDKRSLSSGRLAFEAQQAELERILLPDYTPPPIVGLRDGEQIRHYQQQAIELLRIRRSLLIGDEGGLGKTYTAAGFLCAEPNALPAAVICDSHMQTQWRDKVTSFTTLRVHVITQTKPYDLPTADVYIFRITQIFGWIDFFKSGYFKSMIVDEPQSLRTGTGTAKGAAAKELYNSTTYHLGLSATPIYNYGKEAWQVMQFIDHDVLGTHEDFMREWVDHNGHIKDPKALGTYLREQHVLLRRLKSDVGLELPKVSRIVEYVDYDQKTVDSIEELAHQLAIRATTGTFVERGHAARELDMMVRKATGLSKAKAVAQFARLMVEAGEPVLLLGWHRAVYDIWLEELQDLRPAMYTGSEDARHKEKEKERFMSGDTDILVMSLRSGAGIDDLQHRCSVVIFGELDWSPGIHQQVIWRVDREGQLHPVTVFFLVTDEGSDPPIMKVLGIKSSEARQIIDPNLGVQAVNDDTSNLKRLVQHYLARKPTSSVTKKQSTTVASTDSTDIESQTALFPALEAM